MKITSILSHLRDIFILPFTDISFTKYFNLGGNILCVQYLRSLRHFLGRSYQIL